MVTEPDGSVRLALLASPLLGPAVWTPVADVLRRQGWEVLVPPAYPAPTGPDDVLAHLRGSIPVRSPVVLVPHSNAGLYVAALAASHPVRALVFTDAGLPSDGPATPAAPPGLRAFLADLVERDGRLPVWSRWWPEDEVAGLFPDRGTRAAVEAEQARLPAAYFDATVPSPPGWQDRPAAYLAFGETYAAERDDAHARGWPVATLAGGHLHQLVEPGAVADALVGLLGRLGLRPSGEGPIRV